MLLVVQNVTLLVAVVILVFATVVKLGYSSGATEVHK